jgi:hypothetical protein
MAAVLLATMEGGFERDLRWPHLIGVNHVVVVVEVDGCEDEDCCLIRTRKSATMLSFVKAEVTQYSSLFFMLADGGWWW